MGECISVCPNRLIEILGVFRQLRAINSNASQDIARQGLQGLCLLNARLHRREDPFGVRIST
jgi:hypothetical protein